MSPAPPLAAPETREARGADAPHAPATTRRYMTEAEYLAFMETHDRPFEWINGRGRWRGGEELGEVRPAQGYDGQGNADMPTERHSTIVANLAGLLWPQLRRTAFKTHQGGLAVRDPAGPYYFPDVLVSPDPGEFEPHPDGENLVLRNPVVIFEVLSRSTSRTDRVEKLDAYRRIESVTDYLILSQDRRRVVHHRRDGAVWRTHTHAGADVAVTLAAPPVTLPLADVYERVAVSA